MLNKKKLSLMKKITEHKNKSIFRRVLEDKQVIRECIQKGGDIKQVAKDRGIKFATPIFNFIFYWMLSMI